MILKGSQRGGSKQLGLHLLKTEENEHVEVHEVRGFLSDDVMGAMQEAYAVSKGTQCKQFLFSVSLNPPETENVRIEVFEGAINDIEERNGLTGQPRIVVFHEKEGRRHAHAVWSRIDTDSMTARQLSHFKLKLRDVSKQLYLENGWTMPRGLMDSKARDPLNFTLAEWQQAKRMGRNAKDLKVTIQECWAVSDSKAGFEAALNERGLYLARGDRLHMAVTYEGQALPITRSTGKRAKEVRARLGEMDALPSVDEAKQKIAERLTPRLQSYLNEAQQKAGREMKPLEDRRQSLTVFHTQERQKLDTAQRARWQAEAQDRGERFRHGFKGIWDRLRGEHARIQKQNEMECWQALQRDREQRQALVADQLRERQTLQQEIKATRQRHAEQLADLHGDIARAMRMQEGRNLNLKSHFDRLETLRQTQPPHEIASTPLPTDHAQRLETLRSSEPLKSRMQQQQPAQPERPVSPQNNGPEIER